MSKRYLKIAVSVMMVFMLSVGSVFATDDSQASDQTADQTQVTTETGSAGGDSTAGSDQTGYGSGSDSGSFPATYAEEQQAEPVSHIIKKGKYYYYKNDNGKIRKKAGFVTDLGKRYYIKKGGKIVTGKTFKVKKKKYRARKNGVICTGIYKWGKKYYYSNSSGVWIKKEKLVTWKGSKYHLNKKGVVTRSTSFVYKNIPYKANSKGKLTAIPIPDDGGNAVIAIAKKEVGTATGKKYWKWYFNTKFRNADLTPWCGTFVAWCYNAAGEYSKISGVKKYGNLGYVPSYSAFANKYGKWVKRADAMPGDLIITGSSAHIGLVEGVVGDYILTIEGNTGITAFIRGGKGAVTRRIRPLNAKVIKGIVRP